MGTLFAGFLRAPMTSVFMILEVSGDYSVILPVMISNTIAYLLARTLQPVPIFEVLTQQDGLYLPSMEELRERRLLHVEDAMHPAYSAPLHASDTLETVAAAAQTSSDDMLLAYDAASRWYVFPKADVQKWLTNDTSPTTALRECLGKPVPVLYPDYSLDAALEYLASHPVLPVVHRANRASLIGVVSASNILSAYRDAEVAHEHG
jgi:CIC family chloride channel protein